MKKKNVNYNSKLAHALQQLMKHDEDLWIKGHNENAFNSNLYRRITANKNHKIDMEYDAYIIKTIATHLANRDLKEFILDKTKKNGEYKPKPDIIVHDDSIKINNKIIRDSESIFCVVECKFKWNREGIWKDFLKLSAYKLLWPNISYLNIVVYPNKKEINLNYKKIQKKQKVWNRTTLNNALNMLEDNEGVILHVEPYPSALPKIFSTLKKDVEVFSLGNTHWINLKKDETFKFSINENNTFDFDFDKIKNIPSNAQSSKGIFDDIFKSKYEKEIEAIEKDDQLKHLLSRFGKAKERTLGSFNYLRSGFKINEYDENNYFEPYLFWRNTIVLTCEEEGYKILLQNIKKDALSGFENCETKYTDNPNTPWKAFIPKNNPKSLDNFKKLLVYEGNLRVISNSVMKTTKKILKLPYISNNSSIEIEEHLKAMSELEGK